MRCRLLSAVLILAHVVVVWTNKLASCRPAQWVGLTGRRHASSATTSAQFVSGLRSCREACLLKAACVSVDWYSTPTASCVHYNKHWPLVNDNNCTHFEYTRLCSLGTEITYSFLYLGQYKMTSAEMVAASSGEDCLLKCGESSQCRVAFYSNNACQHSPSERNASAERVSQTGWSQYKKREFAILDYTATATYYYRTTRRPSKQTTSRWWTTRASSTSPSPTTDGRQSEGVFRILFITAGVVVVVLVVVLVVVCCCRSKITGLRREKRTSPADNENVVRSKETSLSQGSQHENCHLPELQNNQLQRIVEERGQNENEYVNINNKKNEYDNVYEENEYKNISQTLPTDGAYLETCLPVSNNRQKTNRPGSKVKDLVNYFSNPE